MLRIIFKSLPIVAPLIFIWFWAILSAWLNPATKWYLLPYKLTMLSILIYLLYRAIRKIEPNF